MVSKSDLKGVVCAVVTPMRDGQPALDNLQRHIRTLKEEGCDGVLLLGTTGEGTSLSREERDAVIQAGMEVRGDMVLLVGTGTPSVRETIWLTRRAFDLGADGTVTLPPYYYKKVNNSGLVAFYRAVLDEAVPAGKLVLAYHIPQVSSMGVPFEVLESLAKYAEDRFVGVKDSTGDLQHGLALCSMFPNLRVFLGNDNLFLAGLKAGAAGCITAASNILTPVAAEIYRNFMNGGDADTSQSVLSAARAVLDRYPPSPASLKSLLALRHGTPGWDVCPPLEPISDSDRDELLAALVALNLAERMPWLQEVTPARL